MSPAKSLAPPEIEPSPLSWRDFLLPGAISAGIVILLFATTPNFRWSEGPEASPFAGDFLQEWVGGKVVLSGDYSRFYDPRYAQQLEHDPSIVPQEWNRNEYLPLVYPPFYYVLVSPLSRLPLVPAAWIWAVSMTACFAGALTIMVRTGGVSPPTSLVEQAELTRRRDAAGTYLPWLLPAAVLFMPVLESLASSQKGSLLLLILTATFALLRSERPFLAGLVFGLLAFKPQLGLVIGAAMLWRGEWKFVVGSAITVAGAVSISLAVGLDVCIQYVDFLRHGADYMANSGYDLAKAHTWLGFFALLTSEPTGLQTRTLAIVALLGTIGLIAWLLRESPPLDSQRFARQFAALVVATILISPHFFTYDLTILLLPLVLVGRQVAEREAEERPAWAWLLPALYLAPALSVSLAGTIGLQITVPLMAGLLYYLARDEAARSP